MDWPLMGALTGIAVLSGAGAYGLVTLIQPDAGPGSPGSRPTRSSARPPATLITGGEQLSIVLNGSREDFNPPTRTAEALRAAQTPRPAKLTDAPPPLDELRENLPDESGMRFETSGSVSRLADPRKPALANDARAKPVQGSNVRVNNTGEAAPSLLVAPPPTAYVWKVTVTEKASYFNLGGHVNRAGIVDSLASSHLRDAFKAHRNFKRLPAEIQEHIMTQNINLSKIAQYRGLLGIDDKKLEEEQAIRFERVAIASR